MRLLMEHAMVVVSGTKIAQEISSSRSEVWRLDPAIAAVGSGRGGSSRNADISCGPCRICSCLKFCGRCCAERSSTAHLHHFYKIGSTNTAAMAAAADGRSRRQRLPGRRADRRPRTRIELLAVAAIDGNLLFRDFAARAASFGRACVVACGGAGGAGGDSAGGLARARRISNGPTIC